MNGNPLRYKIMSEPSPDTVAWYDQHAAAFAKQTADVDLAPIYQRFLRYIPAGGRILDAGCGSGRDALAFSERGYLVSAFDASTEMASLARITLRGRAIVRVRRFDQVDCLEEFDGIWACASLLHVPASEFQGVAQRLARALRPHGAWYMSFKLGQGERQKDGRLFLDHTEKTLRGALSAAPVEVADAWITQDVRPGRASEQWINAVALRQ